MQVSACYHHDPSTTPLRHILQSCYRESLFDRQQVIGWIGVAFRSLANWPGLLILATCGQFFVMVGGKLASRILCISIFATNLIEVKPRPSLI